MSVYLFTITLLIVKYNLILPVQWITAYAALLTSGKLNSYLAVIDQQAEVLFSRLVKRMVSETEPIYSYSVIGGIKLSIALHSLGCRMTKWIAGAFPLDTITHCPA